MSPLVGDTVRTASEMPQRSEGDPSMEQQDVEPGFSQDNGMVAQRHYTNFQC